MRGEGDAGIEKKADLVKIKGNQTERRRKRK